MKLIDFWTEADEKDFLGILDPKFKDWEVTNFDFTMGKSPRGFTGTPCNIIWFHGGNKLLGFKYFPTHAVWICMETEL